MKWFINECLETYEYDQAKQRTDFPNDFPLAFDTEDAAEEEAERMWAWEHGGASEPEGMDRQTEMYNYFYGSAGV